MTTVPAEEAVRHDYPQKVIPKLYPFLSGIDNLDDIESLYDNAAIAADRLPYRTYVLDHIYACSRWPLMPRADWEREVRLSRALDCIFTEFHRHAPSEAVSALVDQKSAKDVAAQLSSEAGALILLFHGGYATLTLRILTDLRKDALLVRKGGIGNFSSKGDARGVLFAALRAIGDGKKVGLAPDGPLGKPSVCINVLGINYHIPEGAAFIAHQSQCSTMWFTLNRDERGFVPVLKFAPRVEPGEPYREFRERLHLFYAKEIELSFTGDPRSICIAGRWAAQFAEQLKKPK
jgi:hypothetical protein